jgi:hypothetical protein
MNSRRSFIIRSGQVSLIVLALLGLDVATARAQTFGAGVHFATAQWSEFDGNDPGVGARFTWMPSSLAGIDADVTWYPRDFPPDSAMPFSGGRIEGLFGVTIGPRLNAMRPFVKAGAGFLNVAATPRGFACIAIFPPPLACALAGGRTLPAYEIGGGIDVTATPRTFVRVDLGDRILKYPGPTLRPDFSLNEDGFHGHAIRLTIGGGVRF